MVEETYVSALFSIVLVYSLLQCFFVMGAKRVS